MYTSEELLNSVNKYLSQMQYVREPKSLYEPIKYVLSLGGKRIRPILMMLAYNLFKDDPESILPIACAIETYHNYTLLHDDLMDNADLRRGHETVHKKWDANTAILSGDSMLVLAYQRIAQCPPEKLQSIIDLFTETALEIGEGQQYDMDFENRTDVTEEEYLKMIRLKTSVLLACSMKIGAILADASNEDAENIYKFGEKIGLAFQLQDDYLDVYGDTNVFGKAIGGDIISNKKTYMTRWITLTSFDAEEKVKQVTRLYNEIGINKLAQQKIASYFEESEKYLDEIHVDDNRKTELRKYAAEMMKREL